MAGEDPF